MTILIGYAYALMYQDKFLPATENFQKILALAPNNAFALSGEIENLSRQGKLKEAEIKFEEFLALEGMKATIDFSVVKDPKNVFISVCHAYLLLRQNKLAETEAKFKEILAVDPNYYFAVKGYLKLLDQQKKLEKPST